MRFRGSKSFSFQPGVPNLEYLGTGDNAFEGNPRGSDISELDPGYRFHVVKLKQIQVSSTQTCFNFNQNK